jgi:hypothetical protein
MKTLDLEKTGRVWLTHDTKRHVKPISSDEKRGSKKLSSVVAAIDSVEMVTTANQGSEL